MRRAGASLTVAVVWMAMLNGTAAGQTTSSTSTSSTTTMSAATSTTTAPAASSTTSSSVAQPATTTTTTAFPAGGGTTTSRVPATTTTTRLDNPNNVSFGDGTHRVGSDIPPGTYRTRYDQEGCYWARLAGFSGELSDIIANRLSDDHQVVTISATDAGFTTDDCGTWTSDLSALTPSTSSPIGDGTWIVHTDLSPGTWIAPGGSGCYWARLAGFSGELRDINANSFGDTNPIVTISSSDVGFITSDCGSWNLPGNSGTAPRLTPPAPAPAQTVSSPSPTTSGAAAPAVATPASTGATPVSTGATAATGSATSALARTGSQSDERARVGLIVVIAGLFIAYRARRSEFERMVARSPVKRR